MSWQRRLTEVLMAFAVTSCEHHDVASSEAVPPKPHSRDSRPLPQADSDTDATLQPLVDAATADLVERLAAQQIDAAQVTVLQAQRVTWRSGALGCPMPDRGYKMVLVPGALIQLRAAATTHEYHSTLRGPPFLCEPPGRIETPAPGDDPRDPT